MVLRGERRSPAGAHSIPIWSRWRSVTLTVSGTTGRITRATGTVYHHDDHLGSTRVCTDASGVSTGACDYEPFGEVQPGTTCSVPTAFRFAGMRFDSDTGLYHTPFRQYDPNQARWMGVDAIPGSNRFEYVLSDPVNMVDPSGLSGQFINGQVRSCTLDGITVDCNQASSWISSGTYVCPLQAGNCDGILTVNGTQVWGYIPQFYWDSAATSSPGHISITVDLQLARWVLLGYAEEFDWLVFSSNFFAGMGDSLTFGVTERIRKRLGNNFVDKCSGAYTAGEWVETGAEIALTGGSAALKVAAKHASRKAVYAAANKMVGQSGLRQSGRFVHHANPLFGHPGGGSTLSTLFPTGGLPASIHSGAWNLKSLSKGAHLAAHARMRAAEAIGAGLVNPAATGARIGRNQGCS